MTSTASVRPIDWAVVSFVVGYHVALLIGLPFYFWLHPPSMALVVVSLVLLFVTEIGIGAAYHRFYSHRCYSLSRPVELVLLFLATLAFQGSALRWSHDHRIHHAKVDTDEDPYSIKKGFWYAHVLWLFRKSPPVDMRIVRDLARNPYVMFQHRHAGLLSLVANIVVWLCVGWAIGDYLGAFVLAWWTRLALSHHLTWFVNSLAHTWGERTFSKEHSAVDNYIIAFLTVGEGYHNYHHTFASDYRNGVRWYHFDPVKWTIWTLSKFGLARGLKRFSHDRIRRRLLAEDKRLLLSTLGIQARRGKADLEARVHQLAEALSEKLGRMAALGSELQRLKQQGARRADRQPVRRELKQVKGSLRNDWRAWTRLAGTVLDSARHA